MLQLDPYLEMTAQDCTAWQLMSTPLHSVPQCFIDCISKSMKIISAFGHFSLLFHWHASAQAHTLQSEQAQVIENQTNIIYIYKCWLR